MRSWNLRNAERLINFARAFVVVSMSLATCLSLLSDTRATTVFTAITSNRDKLEKDYRFECQILRLSD